MVQCGISVPPDAAACILAGECKDREHGQRCLSGVQSPKRMVDEYVEDIQLKKVLGAGFRVQVGGLSAIATADLSGF